MVWREDRRRNTTGANSVHVPAVRRHLPGRDIGTGIAGGINFVKPPARQRQTTP